MSVIVFIICLISCIASIIGYLRRKYKWRSRFMQSNRKLNHYDKRSPYDIYTRDIDIDAPNPYNVYKLFVGQKTRIVITNKGSMITIGIGLIGMN